MRAWGAGAGRMRQAVGSGRAPLEGEWERTARGRGGAGGGGHRAKVGRGSEGPRGSAVCWGLEGLGDGGDC